MRDAQMRATINQRLVETGERERLVIPNNVNVHVHAVFCTYAIVPTKGSY